MQDEIELNIEKFEMLWVFQVFRIFCVFRSSVQSILKWVESHLK